VRKISKRKIAATIAITAILVGGGGAAAIAYWSAGGTGSGTAVTGTSASVAAIQTSTISGLAPGVAAQTLSGNFTNTNAAATYVTSVTASIGTITQASGATGSCTSADYSLSNPVMNVGATVPVGTAQGAWSGATIQFKNNTLANQDGCKGATVAITYTVS
jgi:hypothetical protein